MSPHDLPLYNRACEVVHHDDDCPAIGGGGDKDCRCDAVPFLDALKARLSQGGCGSDRLMKVTPDEEALAVALGDCWNMFLKLPEDHPDDCAEFRHGIHALQNIVLARPARRALTGGAS